MALRKEACNITGGIYRPRHPRASPLYQCVTRLYVELVCVSPTGALLATVSSMLVSIG